VNPATLLRRRGKGELRNIRFDDFTRLLKAVGFERVRTRGSHHVFHHPQIQETMVVQPAKDGDAKPYQMRQLLRLVEQYALHLEDR
jgi:predicted RNA binding protein YcfA (HicA-like mRNA interferase family)